MRTFVDVTRSEEARRAAERFYSIVLGPEDYRVVDQNARDAKHCVKEALCIFPCKEIASLKKMARVHGLLLLLQTKLDRESVNLMKQYGSIPVLSLETARRAFNVFAWNVHVLVKTHTKFLLITWAENAADVRAPRELAALCTLCGATKPQALAAMSTWWEGII